MEADPTNASEPEQQQEKDKEREQSRNFWIAVVQGTFIRISFAFADSTTVLPAFILKLTSSNTLVGLTGSMTRAGWMWPQLLMSNLLEHRPRKMPFYALGMGFRLFAWIAMVACTLMVGFWQQRFTRGVFSLLLFHQILSDGSLNAPIYGYYLQIH